MKPRGHHWVFIVVVIALAYHYRAQLLAAWRVNVAPALASVLPPSVAALVGTGTHPLDVPDSSRQGGGGDTVAGPNGRVMDPNSLSGGPGGFPGGFNGFGGSGGGAIDYSYLAAGSLTGPYPNGSGSPCSTHLTDGKPLCA